ncbi:aldo/keto reductase [Kitasatospora sp. NPDC101183]|uniref:aldo/keto reductase n=1 Tax=Kitasatospora sp. NPDC101183 TaxID=3364100 RepID=UPI0038232A47
MRTRRLGATGPTVGAVGLGCMGMNWVYTSQRQSAAESIAAVRHAVDLGVTLLDTSDLYGPFTNEELLGEALSGGLRERVVLATKGGLRAGPDSRPDAVQVFADGRPEHLRAAVEGSLRRLRTDRIDLYFLHRVDPAVPLAESWGALAELQQEGKIDGLGLSEVSPAQLDEAHAIAPVVAVQSELSMWSRDPLAEVLPWCEAHGAAFVPFSPLGRGFLAGRFDEDEALGAGDFRAGLPRFQAEARARNQRITDGVRAVAARHGATPAQVALAWALAQGEHVVPIPGSTRPAHIGQNAAAADLRLDAADLAGLDSLPAAVGTRY